MFNHRATMSITDKSKYNNVKSPFHKIIYRLYHFQAKPEYNTFNVINSHGSWIFRKIWRNPNINISNSI